MNRDQISRSDFPSAAAGYDRPSVDAHLEAVAALAAALEAQVRALEVECEALRRQPAAESGPAPAEPAIEPASGSDLSAPEHVEPGKQADEVSARLVATRLALEGVERDRIRERLEQTYDLDDTASLVDDVLERLA